MGGRGQSKNKHFNKNSWFLFSNVRAIRTTVVVIHVAVVARGWLVGWCFVPSQPESSWLVLCAQSTRKDYTRAGRERLVQFAKWILPGSVPLRSVP